MRRVFLVLGLLFLIQPALMAGHGIERLGDNVQLLLPVSAMAMGVAFQDRQGLMQLAEALAATEISTHVLKAVVHKRRPNGGSHSFPSGHTAISFAGAAFIQRRYGWQYGVPAYVAASFVGYSRVQCKAHDVVDVLSGAAIGILWNVLFTTRDSWLDCTCTPVVTSDCVALILEKSF